ncbi:MAG: hypothetical protein M3347_19165 [Armatimonadota bacterium]|nr:hypothetical protein [Armatimonadota bacterium]
MPLHIKRNLLLIFITLLGLLAYGVHSYRLFRQMNADLQYRPPLQRPARNTPGR